MTAIYSRTFYRTDINVPFPPEPAGLAEHVSTNYSAKCITWRDTTVSEDGLIKVATSTWVNLEELLLAKQDPLLIEYAQTTEQYCADNGIITYSSNE